MQDVPHSQNTILSRSNMSRLIIFFSIQPLFNNIWSTVYYCIPANIYLLKINNKYTSKKCKICSKSEIKTPVRCQWRRFGIFIVNFQLISHFFSVSVADFKQAYFCRDTIIIYATKI